MVIGINNVPGHDWVCQVSWPSNEPEYQDEDDASTN